MMKNRFGQLTGILKFGMVLFAGAVILGGSILSPDATAADRIQIVGAGATFPWASRGNTIMLSAVSDATE